MTTTAPSANRRDETDVNLYPVFLKLTERPVLVVGGGNVAHEKLSALLAAGASITVVAPEIQREIAAMNVRCVRRNFREQDLDGVWYVVSAAPPEVNRLVERVARRRRVFVNAVDDAKQASCYLGGVVRKGGVTFAVSTAGRLPALAGMLREALDALIPAEIEQWVRLGQSAREQWNRDKIPHHERRPLLLRVLNDIYETKLSSSE